MAIALLTACLVWVFVDIRDNRSGALKTVVVNDIPIDYMWEDTILADRGLMLLPDSDQTISLELEARRLVIAKLDPEKIRVQVDLSGVTTTGEQNIKTNIYFPREIGSASNVTLKGASTYMAHVNIGELYSREVEIRCSFNGSVAEGYIAGELDFQPATVVVRGQQEYVDQVAYAKVVLDVDNVEETVTQTLAYQFCDKRGNPIEDTRNLHATTDVVQVTLPVYVVKELPLVMRFQEAAGARESNLEYAITPRRVTVSGEASRLRGVEQIVLNGDEIFDLAEFSTPTTYSYPIPIPEGCENLSGANRATLTIRYRDMAARTLSTVNFRCENEPEGKTVTVLTEELPVHIRGTSADVEAVLPEDVTAIVDLTDVTAASGSYTLPARVQIQTSGDVGIVGTYQVRVSISDTPPEAPPDDSPEEPGGAGNNAPGWDTAD